VHRIRVSEKTKGVPGDRCCGRAGSPEQDLLAVQWRCCIQCFEQIGGGGRWRLIVPWRIDAVAFWYWRAPGSAQCVPVDLCGPAAAVCGCLLSNTNANLYMGGNLWLAGGLGDGWVVVSAQRVAGGDSAKSHTARTRATKPGDSPGACLLALAHRIGQGRGSCTPGQASEFRGAPSGFRKRNRIPFPRAAWAARRLPRG